MSPYVFPLVEDFFLSLAESISTCWRSTDPAVSSSLIQLLQKVQLQLGLHVYVDFELSRKKFSNLSRLTSIMRTTSIKSILLSSHPYWKPSSSTIIRISQKPGIMKYLIP